MANQSVSSHITFDHTTQQVLFIDQASHHVDNTLSFFTCSTACSDFDENFTCFLYPFILLHQNLFFFCFSPRQELLSDFLFPAKFSAALLVPLSSFSFLLFLFSLTWELQGKVYLQVEVRCSNPSKKGVKFAYELYFEISNDMSCWKDTCLLISHIFLPQIIDKSSTFHSKQRPCHTPLSYITEEKHPEEL